MGYFTVRKANPADMPALLSLAQAFVAESALPYRFHAGNAELGYRVHMEAEEADVLVVDGPRGIAAAAIVVTDIYFMAEPIGYVVKFYVDQDARRSVVGRMLAGAVVAWFDDRKCSESWATATGGIGSDRAFTALMGKFGFEPTGPTLRRSDNG